MKDVITSKNRNIKIAITGSSVCKCTIISTALSYITSVEVIGSTPYAAVAVKYGFKKDMADCNWAELFVYAFSSFSERTIIEQNYDSYISNGSVFNELAQVRVFSRSLVVNESSRTEIDKMCSSLERVVNDYALREYEEVFHIFLPEEKLDQWSEMRKQIDEELTRVAENSNVKFYHFLNLRLEEVLYNIVSILNIKAKMPIEIALEKAMNEFTNNKIWQK